MSLPTNNCGPYPLYVKNYEICYLDEYGDLCLLGPAPATGSTGIISSPSLSQASQQSHERRLSELTAELVTLRVSHEITMKTLEACQAALAKLHLRFKDLPDFDTFLEQPLEKI